MRHMTWRWAWGLAVAGMILSACATPYGQAVKRARQAEDLGNERNALAAWREACALKDPAHRTCIRARELADLLADRAVEAAEAICLDGFVDRCTDALAQVAGPATDHPEVEALIARSQNAAVHWDAEAVAAVEACVAGARADVAGSLRSLACVQAARQAPLDRPAFRDRFAELAPVLSAPVRDRADAAPAGGRHALLSAAACIDRGNHDARVSALSAFLAASSRPLDVRFDWTGAGPRPPAYDGLCERAAAEVTGLSCGSGDDALVVKVTVHEGSPEHTMSETEESVRYRSGTQVVHNPDYDATERRLARAEYALAESEPVHHEWEAACASAERAHSQAGYCFDCPERETRTYHCDMAERAKGVYERHVREVADARRALGRTPARLEIAEYDVHRYVARHHRWNVDYLLAVEAPARPSSRRNGAHRVSFASSERPGFAPASVSRKTREDPPPGHFSQAIARRAVAEAVAVARDVRRAEAPDPEAVCVQLDLAEWADCRAEVALATGRIFEPKEALALIARRLGITDPLPRCR